MFQGQGEDSFPIPAPNIGLELTASSVRSCLAPASSSSSGPAFGRLQKQAWRHAERQRNPYDRRISAGGIGALFAPSQAPHLRESGR